jgi:hypothetical protein
MRSDAVEHQIADLAGTPAVSILCPLDRHQPGNPHDVEVLADLRHRAVDGIHAALSGHAASSLVSDLDTALGTIDLHHPTSGFAVFVSPTASRVITLGAAVSPRVVVGDGFALLDVLATMSRELRARILVLSQTTSRCIDMVGDDATERVSHGFPVAAVAPTEADTPHRDFPLSEHEYSEAAKYVFRAVANALTEVHRLDPRPIVLVGAERDLAYFEAMAPGDIDVVGRVHGNHERDSALDVARVARPALEHYRGAEQQAACTEVREAMTTRALGGIADVWAAARAGRGHRLVVEEGCSFPAKVADGSVELTSAGEVGSFDAVDDTVRAVIRDGGEVVVVGAGELADLGRIALLTRY